MDNGPELLLEFDVSILEDEYNRLAGIGETGSATVQAADDGLRLAIAREFVEFVRELVSEEFELGIFVDVERVTAAGIIGSIDFPADRAATLASVERRVLRARGAVPPCCGEGRPVLDRLLSCMEIVRAPDRSEEALGDFKRECVMSFSTGGWLENSGGRGEPADGFFFG